MRLVLRLKVVFVSLGLVTIFSGGPVAGEVFTPAAEAVICSNVQSHMDKVVGVLKSSGVSDEQKMVVLRESWADCWQTFSRSMATDPEGARMLRELSEAVGPLLAAIQASLTADRKDATDDMKPELARLRGHVAPYLSVMKLLCPDLAVPDVTGR